ncbi:hypothetical protein [Haloarchaeobius iranensis]|uniref:Uncharacterized protein n=1 Tax=Haloarchaeobius iranensis TaxID=996166 RepID=A0A1G9SFC0_9EURY|nr:hypothetical protein [Haloarchaeobius iranensis]SDM34102.1 hypothetical protein SAMN05192554_101146 [Haloarchaeobius iranensis]
MNGTERLGPFRRGTERFTMVLVLLAVASASVAYEVGSVLAGAPLDLAWVVPVVGCCLTCIAGLAATERDEE